MQAIHFINKRDDGGKLKNFILDKASGSFRSGNWNISEEDAQALIGGWIYLHPSKISPSEFGGIVSGFEPVVDTSVSRSDRIVLLGREQPQGTKQSWRGKSHGMAHSSGLVAADLPHETVQPPAEGT